MLYIHNRDSVGSDVVAMAYRPLLARVPNIAAGKTGSVLCACLARLKTSITFCLTAPDTVTYVSSTATLRLLC